MTFESEGLLIVAIYIWLPRASYVVFLTTLVTPYLNTEASVRILADFGPEFNPPFCWRSKIQTKNQSAYQ